MKCNVARLKALGKIWDLEQTAHVKYLKTKAQKAETDQEVKGDALSEYIRTCRAGL